LAPAFTQSVATVQLFTHVGGSVEDEPPPEPLDEPPPEPDPLVAAVDVDAVDPPPLPVFPLPHAETGMKHAAKRPRQIQERIFMVRH